MLNTCRLTDCELSQAVSTKLKGSFISCSSMSDQDTASTFIQIKLQNIVIQVVAVKESNRSFQTCSDGIQRLTVI